MKGSTFSSMWICALALAFAAGCGGGEGGGSEAQSLHTSKAGNATFTYFGNPKPLATTSTGLVSVLEQAGATFSNVTLEPPANLSDTYLVYSRAINNGNGELYKSNYTNVSNQQFLYSSSGNNIVPSISAYGTVLFNDVVSNKMLTVRPDGTGLTQISFTGIPTAVGGHYSVDGTNRLTFINGSDVYIGPGTGGSSTLLQTNMFSSGVSIWNTSGTQIAYPVAVGSSGNSDIFTTSTSGGTTVDITPTTLQNTGTFFPMAWSADGVTVLAAYTPSGGDREIITFATNNPTEDNVITPAGDTDSEACFSPDGTMIAIERTNGGGAAPGVYLCDGNGLFQNLVVPDPQGTSTADGIAWSPFLPKETVIAASGSTFYHKAASGFLLSQTGSQFGSLVAFTANTPADAVIQSPANTTSAGAPLIFTLTADSITSLGYINSYFSPGTTLTLTSTPTVVVTVDGSTGQIDLVAPAATAKPAIAKNPDGTVTYSAKFSAVYDGHGKNLAPTGASRLVLNPKTGGLASLQ